MLYPFIDLKKATKEELVAHLREQCGIEKDGKKEELVQAILDFESSSGLVRPDTPTENELKETPPVDLPKRVRIIIAPSEADNSDVYVGLNDLDILIKRGEEVSVPESVYVLLSKAGEHRFEQNKDGTYSEYFAPRYSITVLGDA
ncbi:hypothetical protein [Haemophilus haemolyticus]|uniref:hypothetical protein n=1 Tax=Haemophilus haemolyticus TaxID=726 RepID=UPI000E0D77DB|nr:hypothetical protein [Haemophilus haemolyticus]